MTILSLFIAGDPVAKGRPRVTVRNGRAWAYTPRKTEVAEKAIRALAQIEMRGKKPVEGPVCLTYTATLPIPKSWPKKKRAAAIAGSVLPTTKPDLDNAIKLLADSLIGVAYAGDQQIVAMVAFKRYGERPGIDVEVAEIA